jgi:RecB family exonuclease
MVTYSYSKINSFISCPLKFKFSYLDKEEKDFETSIEGHLGTTTHSTLEKLYKDLQHGKLNSKKELLDFYKKEWDKEFKQKTKIVKPDYSEKDTKSRGVRYISDYYDTYSPFDQDYTVGLEQQVYLKLGDDKYTLTGYIDRLAIKKDGTYVIHDYKTSGTLPTIEYIDEDKQLALYSLAVKEKYPDAKKIELVWHYLGFGKEIRITKSDEKLEEIKRSIKSWIDKIEEEKKFSPKESPLCDWCEFASKCPKRKHIVETKQMSLDRFSTNTGVKLVDKYTELVVLKNHIAEQLKELEESIERYSAQEKVDNIQGTSSLVKVFIEEGVRLPSKTSKEYTEIKEQLIQRGFSELLDINQYYIDKRLESIPEPLKSQIKTAITKKETKKLRLITNSFIE